MMRTALFCWLLFTSACLKLDPFLFAATSTATDVLDPLSDDPKEVIDPARIERVHVSVNADVELSGVIVAAPASGSRGHVMYFAGQGATLDDAFGRIKRLSNAGFDVFAVNYRGFGTSSDVTPSEAGIGEDVTAALAYWKERLPVGTAVGYYGRSLGTAIATQLAADESPAALVLESPFASIEALAADSSAMDFPIGFLASVRYDTESRIRDIHTPLLILHGLVDDYVRHEFGVRVFNAANEPKQLILVEGADHSDVPQKMGDGWDEAVRNHFVPLAP